MKYKFNCYTAVDVFNVKVAIRGLLHNSEIDFDGDEFDYFSIPTTLIYFKASVWKSELVKALV